MAKKENQSARTSLEEVNDTLSSWEQKVEGNKKIIYYAGGAIVAVAVIVLAYIYLWRIPQADAAKEDISKADMELFQGQDSLALKDYEKVASDYSNKPANRANLNAAILLYQKGKYQEAVKYLNDFDAEGNLVGPASQSLLGDCYVNLKQYDDAIKAFDKAISLAGDNVNYTPLFLMKKATVLHELKKYADEAAAYQTIKDKYPQFMQTYGVNVDKYIERANALGGK